MVFYVELKFMKIFIIFSLLFFLSILSGCQTIENKTQETIKKENEKLGKFLQRPETELKIAMGEPDKIIYDNAGVKFLIYMNKKYQDKKMQSLMQKN